MSGLQQGMTLNVKFKPRLAGQLHLGKQQKAFVWFHINDLPEIQRITNPQICRISSAPIQPVTSKNFVYKSS